MDIRQPIPTNGGDWLSKFGESWKKQCAQLQAELASCIEEIRMPPEHPTDVPVIFAKKDAILEVLGYLKNTEGFEYNFLADITATDEEGHPRFDVVYHLFSMTHKNRIRVKARVGESEEIPSAVGLWKGANWAEREVFDMFGVKFKDHPNLRRILMDSRWVGHPLRKDYSLKGYQMFTDAQAVDPSLLDK
jgi:NADH-quinone oxidoreductase subunit C